MNPRILHHKVVMVPHAPVISESEVSITVLCLLCLSCYTAVKIKDCSKITSVIKVATVKNTMMLCTPVIVWNWSIHFLSLSAIVNSLHSSTNQELFEKHLCNLGSHFVRFPVCKGSHHVQPPSQHFSLSAKINGTQRRTMVSPWRIHWMYYGLPKGTSRAKAMLNSEKIKPVALAIIKLH